MIQIPIEIVEKIACHIEQKPPYFVHLAQISKSFYTVFMSDELWQPFNVLSVDLGIAQDFVSQVRDKERALAYQLYTSKFVPIWIQEEAANSTNPHVQLALIYHQLLPFSMQAFSTRAGCGTQIYASLLPSKPLEIFEDREMVSHLVSSNGLNLKYATADLQADSELVMTAVSNNGKALRYASYALRSDPEICLKAGPDGFPYAAECIWANKNVLLNSLRNDNTGTILSYTSSSLRDEWNIAHTAVSHCGKAMEFVSDRLKKSRTLVLAAKNFPSFAYKYADASIKNDKDFVIELLRRSQCTVYHLPETLKNNYEIVMAAVRINGESLSYVPNFMDNPSIVKAAVENTPHALAGVSDRWKNDKPLVLSAVKRNGYALVYASDKLRNDRDVVRAAVSQYGKHIRDASEILRKDPEIVATACLTYPLASNLATCPQGT